MAEVLFLSEDFFKSKTVVDDNVGAKTLKAIIARSQDFYIEPLLGTDLYEKLKTDIAASTITGNYLTLLTDWVVPTLILYVESEVVYQNHYRLRNKGTQVKNSENSSPASLDELKFKMDRAQNMAEQKGMKMIAYLCDNEDLFPEYCDNEDGGDLDPIRSAASVGWVLGNVKLYDGKKDKDYYENK
jgi:hypothetical protein